MRSAAKTTLECLGGGGGDCTSGERTAWHALGDLGLIETEPAPLLGKALLDRAQRRDRSGIDKSRQGRLNAGAVARDMSCRIVAMRRVGPQMLRRRAQLVARAQNLGFGSLAIGQVVGSLAVVAAQLKNVHSVRARCRRGDLFLLVSPPSRAIDSDEDPRAHGSAGWAVFTIGVNEAVLVRGGVPVHSRPRPIQADRVGGAPVDSWIPLGEVDL